MKSDDADEGDRPAELSRCRATDVRTTIATSSPTIPMNRNPPSERGCASSSRRRRGGPEHRRRAEERRHDRGDRVERDDEPDGQAQRRREDEEEPERRGSRSSRGISAWIPMPRPNWTMTNTNHGRATVSIRPSFVHRHPPQPGRNQQRGRGTAQPSHARAAVLAGPAGRTDRTGRGDSPPPELGCHSNPGQASGCCHAAATRPRKVERPSAA